METGRGSSGVRRAALAGALALLLGGTEAMAARNCVSNTGNGRNARLRGSLKAVALTADGRLLCFRTGSPGEADVVGAVSGLGSPDSSLVGIDFRVQDGNLYGVGNGGGVYAIDPTSGVATLVDQLSIALDPMATSFAVDFNPAADRLRILSDRGQNLRHDVNPGGVTVADAPLTIMAGTSVVTASGVSAAAYTNNDLAGATGTTLYDITTMQDQVVLQSPPNGVPGAVAPNLLPTGALGVDAGPAAGLDVYSIVVDGVTVGNLGYGVLAAFGGTGFYRISLDTGRADFVGAFREPVVDIALPVGQN